MRRMLGVCVAAVVAWWLFADTYARHAASPGDTSTIRFSHFGGYEEYAMWREIIAMFERRHPGVHVRQEYVVGFADRYTMKLRQQILSGTLPDVALIQYAPFHELAEHFADLSDLIERSSPPKRATDSTWPRSDSWTMDDPLGSQHPRGLKSAARGRREVNLEPTALAAFRSHDGTQRGLPVSGGNLLIYCNTECFKRAESFHGRAIPLPSTEWTMDDFRRTAELLTCDFDGDGRFDQFGFWLPRWVYYLPFLWSHGGQLCDGSSGRWRLTGPGAERAFAFYRDLAVGRRVCPKPEEVPQLFQDVGFLTGKVGMCINGPWFQPFLDSTRLADKYVVAPIPIGPAGRVTRITWDGLVVAPDLPPARDERARQFVRFVLSKPVQQHIAHLGRALPARTDALEAFVDPPGNPVRQPFIDALDYSRLQPTISAFVQVDRAVNRRLARLADPNETVSIPDMLADLLEDPNVGDACVKRRE